MSTGYGSATIFYIVVIVIVTILGLIPIFLPRNEHVPLNVAAWVFGLVIHILVAYGLYELSRNGCYGWAWGVIGIMFVQLIAFLLYALAHSSKLQGILVKLRQH